ncbi:hypothetical protein SAMN04489844_1979 [Nocardioides exalbidus]|uniref:Uncharacterized protein n=1 Tax=Nocardioides exalbidus TaxID=402596 RepID=A0A1H4R3X8_9ACTN|nr:hypothetical protein [Nocardioides exalbidus]SEC26592.1 hypothetical protein SAMN04489844_1979 [Nocardioides exalbidus]
MRFTEHELTVAVTAAAKIVAGGKIGKRGKGEEKWEAMSKIDRYHLLEAVGSQVLPVMLALPDIEVEAGTRPTFTDEQIGAAVEQTLGESGVGRIRQKVAVAARLTLVRTALAELPVRQDPDALVVPDTLEDL